MLREKFKDFDCWMIVGDSGGVYGNQFFRSEEDAASVLANVVDKDIMERVHAKVMKVRMLYAKDCELFGRDEEARPYKSCSVAKPPNPEGGFVRGCGRAS